MGYGDTIAYLYALQSHGIKLGLDNPRELLSRAGDPQHAFQGIHIAGTNGKGSTAAMLTAMLGAAGHRTGLFTSPHLVSFTERIRVDGREISQDDVVELAGEVRRISEGLEPTFFEVVTVMGFLYFQRNNVRWAVVETGMGGRLDATNTLSPRVTIITPIGFDHREFLGTTLREIAREKAGIIKPGIPVVCAQQEPEALEVIQAVAGERGAPLLVLGTDFTAENVRTAQGHVMFDYQSGGLEMKNLKVPLSGAYQAMNAAMAIQALDQAIGAVPEFEGWVEKGIGNLHWPGRMELVADGPPTYVDGAHNPRAAEALADMLRTDFLADGRPLTLVLGVMGDKDVEGVIRPLLRVASQVIFAAPAYGRSAPVERLIGVARDLGVEAESAPSVAEAVQRARALGEMVLVTGSFYTIGEAKEALGSTGFLTRLREWQAAP